MTEMKLTKILLIVAVTMVFPSCKGASKSDNKQSDSILATAVEDYIEDEPEEEEEPDEEDMRPIKGFLIAGYGNKGGFIYDGDCVDGVMPECFFTADSLVSILRSYKNPKVHFDVELYNTLSKESKEYLSSIGYVQSHITPFISEKQEIYSYFQDLIDLKDGSRCYDHYSFVYQWINNLISLRKKHPNDVWRIPKLLIDAIPQEAKDRLQEAGLGTSLIKLY